MEISSLLKPSQNLVGRRKKKKWCEIEEDENYFRLRLSQDTPAPANLSSRDMFCQAPHDMLLGEEGDEGEARELDKLRKSVMKILDNLGKTGGRPGGGEPDAGDELSEDTLSGGDEGDNGFDPSNGSDSDDEKDDVIVCRHGYRGWRQQHPLNLPVPGPAGAPGGPAGGGQGAVGGAGVPWVARHPPPNPYPDPPSTHDHHMG